MTIDLGLHLLRLLRPQVNGEAFPGDGPDGVGVVADDVADANLQSRLFRRFYSVWRLNEETSNDRPGNTKGGSITVPFTSCLTGLESAVCQLTIFVLICKTDLSKPVKQEVNGTVILPPLVFPGLPISIFVVFWVKKA